MALGSYWLPRVGILLVAIGTVWGFTYVAQQFKDAVWMPYARVGLGYFLSFGLLGVGRALETKYTNYARVLMGGGFGLIYFVTFATWYIPGTRITPSQEFTLLLLALLVAVWGALAHWRRSQLIALTMTLLGHFTVALSTLSLESPSRAAVGGLLLLGIGSAWFLVRHGWFVVAMTAMIGSYLNQFFWLARSPGSDAPVDFMIGMAVLAAYLVTYALAEFLTPPARRTASPRIQNIFVTLNTTGFVLLGLGLIRAFPFARPYEHFLYFATALFTLTMGLAYLQRYGKVRIATMYFTKTSVLVTLGLATWLDGSTLTLSLALQALVLLFTARYAREHAGRLLSLAVALVAFVHGLYVILYVNLPARGEAGFAGEVAVALTIVALFVVLVEVYRVTPWQTFPFSTFPNASVLNRLCAILEMHPEGYAGGPGESRMIFTHGLAFLGTALFGGYCVSLLSPGGTLLGLGFGALLVAAVALFRASVPLLSATVFMILFIGWSFANVLHDSETVSKAVLALGAIAPLFLLSEAYGMLVPRRFAAYAQLNDIQGAWYRNHHHLALGCAALAAILVMFFAAVRFPTEQALLLCGSLALAATVYGTITGSVNLGLAGLLLVLFTGCYSIEATSEMTQPWMATIGLVIATIAATAVERRWWGARAGLALHHLLPAPYVAYGAIAWGGMWLLNANYLYPVLPVTLVLLAVAFGVALPWLHRRAMALATTAITLVALVTWVGTATPEVPGPWFHGAFVALLVVAVAGDRLFAYFQPFPKPLLGRLLLVIAWIACTHYNIEITSNLLYYVGLAGVALAFLVYGAAFKTRTAVVLSLVSGIMASVPLLLMPLSPASIVLIVAAYASVITYWLCTERGTTIVLERTGIELLTEYRILLNMVLTGLPTLLGIVALTRIEAIHDYYLTIGWTVWALALFVWALTTRQPWFRYAALATIGLATSRAFFVDVWKLEGLYRVGAMIFLGLALLSVAYGYTRWRAMQKDGNAPGDSKEELDSDRMIED